MLHIALVPWTLNIPQNDMGHHLGPYLVLTGGLPEGLLSTQEDSTGVVLPHRPDVVILVCSSQAIAQIVEALTLKGPLDRKGVQRLSW